MSTYLIRVLWLALRIQDPSTPNNKLLKTLAAKQGCGRYIYSDHYRVCGEIDAYLRYLFPASQFKGSR